MVWSKNITKTERLNKQDTIFKRVKQRTIADMYSSEAFVRPT